MLNYDHDLICGVKNPIGLKIPISAGNGEASCEWTVTENFVGYDTILHGGIIASILDNLMIFACRSQMELDLVTANLNVNYRHFAHVGDHLSGFGRMVSNEPGSRKVFAEAKLYCDNTLIAEASGINVIVYPK